MLYVENDICLISVTCWRDWDVWLLLPAQRHSSCYLLNDTSHATCSTTLLMLPAHRHIYVTCLTTLVTCCLLNNSSHMLPAQRQFSSVTCSTTPHLLPVQRHFSHFTCSTTLVICYLFWIVLKCSFLFLILLPIFGSVRVTLRRSGLFFRVPGGS